MSSEERQYRIPCPNCKANLVIPDLEDGVDIVCPRCRQEFASESVDPALVEEVTAEKQGPAPASAPLPESAQPQAQAQPQMQAPTPDSAEAEPEAPRDSETEAGEKARGSRHSRHRKQFSPLAPRKVGSSERAGEREREREQQEAPTDDLHQLMEEANSAKDLEDQAQVEQASATGAPPQRRERKPKPDHMPVQSGKAEAPHAKRRHHQDGPRKRPGKRAVALVLLLLALAISGFVYWRNLPDDTADPAAVATDSPEVSGASDPAPAASATAPDDPTDSAAAVSPTTTEPAVPGYGTGEIDSTATADLPEDSAPPAPPELPEKFSLQEFLTVGRPPAPERKNWQKAAALAQVALESPSWQDLLNYVRAPDHVEPLMREYYRKNPYQPQIVDTINGLRLSDNANGRTFAFLVVQLENFDLVRMSLELVDDAFKLDWESFVGLQEMPWSDFRFKKPAHPVEFRVGIMEEQALGVSQITKSDYHAFRLIRPGEASLPAYIPKDHPDAPQLFTMVQDGGSHDVILKLRYTPDPTGGEFVEIVDLVQEGWVRDYGSAAAAESVGNTEGSD